MALLAVAYENRINLTIINLTIRVCLNCLNNAGYALVGGQQRVDR